MISQEGNQGCLEGPPAKCVPKFVKFGQLWHDFEKKVDVFDKRLVTCPPDILEL